MSKLKIYMGVMSTGTVVDSQTFLLRDIQALYQNEVELVYPSSLVRRKFHDYARNEVVKEFLCSDCDILWFLDSDITPPTQILDLVINHGSKWLAAGATYPVFMNALSGGSPEVVFTCYQKNSQTGNLAVAQVPTSGAQFVDGLATGCLFLKREVFTNLKAPWFEFKYDPKTREMIEGEDLGFCRKLSDTGTQFFTDFSMVCKHEKTVDLLDVNNYAISYANRSVITYDTNIKAQVEEAVRAAYKQGLIDGATKVPKETSRIWTPR